MAPQLVHQEKFGGTEGQPHDQESQKLQNAFSELVWRDYFLCFDVTVTMDITMVIALATEPQLTSKVSVSRLVVDVVIMM